MATSSIEVSLVGSSIAIVRGKGGNPAIDYYPVSNILNITSTSQANYNLNAGGGGPTHEYNDLYEIHIEFVDSQSPRLTFDVQDVTNQPTWTADTAGVLNALLSINSFVSSGSGTSSASDSLGGEGTEFIATGVVLTSKAYKYIVMNEDATFTSLAGSVTADLKATLLIAENTVTKGMIIRGLDGETISEVNLATGTAIGVL